MFPLYLREWERVPTHLTFYTAPLRGRKYLNWREEGWKGLGRGVYFSYSQITIFEKNQRVQGGGKNSGDWDCIDSSLELEFALLFSSKSCWVFCDPMDYIACQAPLSVEFSKQEYWSELPFPSPGFFLTQGWNPRHSALAGGFFTAEPSGKPRSWDSFLSMLPSMQTVILIHNLKKNQYSCYVNPVLICIPWFLPSRLYPNSNAS